MSVADASGELVTSTPTATKTGRALPELNHGPKRLWQDRGQFTTANTSPERTRVWTEPATHKPKRVSVVYYLSRNGKLEHPHFMEVPLSSPDGLFLRDVISRLNLLRGSGMASLYSWSSKSSRPLESVSFRSPKLTEAQCEDSNVPAVVLPRRRNQSWNSIDLQEYKVYKTELSGELAPAARTAADAATQTDDRWRRYRRPVKAEQKEFVVTCPPEPEKKESQTTELTRDEISPPPSDSSPETLETLLKANGRMVLAASTGDNSNRERPDRTTECLPSGGRMRASAVLMQLITCGSFSFRNCGANYVKDQGLSLISQYKPATSRGGKTTTASIGNGVAISGEASCLSKTKLEDKEYFSGSLIETSSKKLEAGPALKRSSSYNADGSRNKSRSQMQLGEKDMEDGVRAKCNPRKL
ncbi:hypothetical protein SAY87_017902 [Trapa incisa]|uniref:SOSEKI DIX-like domain-containing protein n=1 Tax=Trapa incisa TaxID=236973 RepID=A0AAN7L9T2_9MYRT|nr:hypothetical protein SAY87_017902 [Trapa incisa]